MTKKSELQPVAPVAKATYSSSLAICVSATRNAGNTGMSITKFASGDDAILDVWSKPEESVSVALGTKALIRTTRMPDGKRFHHLE
jgi:hypothetical protein